MRVLALNDDNHETQFFGRNEYVTDNMSWDIREYISWLSQRRNYSVETRCVFLVDIDEDSELERAFNIVYDLNQNVSTEERRQAFEKLWEISTENLYIQEG